MVRLGCLEKLKLMVNPRLLDQVGSDLVLCFGDMGLTGMNPTCHQPAKQQQHTYLDLVWSGKERNKPQSSVFYLKQWNVDFSKHFC